MTKFLATVAGILLVSLMAASDVPEDGQTGFVYARIRYHMLPWEYEMREEPWHHDYPYGDELFPTLVKQMSHVDTSPKSYQIVDIDSEDLFRFPFAYMSEPGYLDLRAADVVNLREYLDRGGFIMVDDFRGYRALENLRFQMKKVYPQREIVRLDLSHEVFHSFYEMESLDMTPPYGRSPVEFMGLSDEKGNLQMVINYNNDLSEIWEWLDRGEMPLREASMAVKFGVNYLIYAMTH